jgi:hypothetical protein
LISYAFFGYKSETGLIGRTRDFCAQLFPCFA